MKTTKTCTSCYRDFSLEFFRKQAGTKDGRQYQCKTCAKLQAATIYQNNPEILEKNKKWQENNKEKHNEAAKRYYHSPTGRLNRGLNKALDGIFGPKRESLLHIIGTSVSALVVHIVTTLPADTSLEDYQEKWVVGFIKEPKDFSKLSEEQIRKVFNWTNLCAKEKSQIAEDFGVKKRDDA